jgi:hypothetical protein
MTETITSAMVAAVLLSPGWLPVRETETRHGGAVVIRTVARPENGPDQELVEALREIQSMAEARKSCIRMPNGMMLDNFCRLAISKSSKQTP